MTFRKGCKFHTAALLGVAAVFSAVVAGGTAQAPASEAVLLRSHFADLKDNWTIWDNPAAEDGPSRWRLGLAELSGIARRDQKISTALLGGGADWADYAVETSLYMANGSGNLVGIVFGYQGAEQFYITGYNFDSGCYELEARTPAGFEVLQSLKKRFPSDEDVGLRVDFGGSHIRFTAGGEVIFDVDESRSMKGRFGLGASDLRGARVHFGRVKVTGLQGSPAADKILFEDDFSSGDLLKWQVWDDPSASPKKSQWRFVLSEYSGIRNALDETATAVVAGEAGWSAYAARTNLYAVQSSGGLSGLVFGYQDAAHFYIAGYNFGRSRFELAERTARGFSVLAFAKMDFPRQEWHPIEVEFRAGRLIFRFAGRPVFDLDEGRFLQGRVGLGTSRLSGGDVLFDAFEVTSLGKSAAPKKELQDLLAFRRGAAVIYRPSPPKSESFEEIIDHSLDDPKSYTGIYDLDLEEARLPEEAVFCFPQGRFAEIRRIVFALAREDAPKEIRFWVSKQTPKSGFEPLATINLKAKPDSVQEFDVPQTKAKYLKIQIVSGYSAKRVRILEMFVRGRFLENPPGHEDSDVLGRADIPEKEPNDPAGRAQTVPLSKFVGGRASGSDTDFFKISLKDKPAGTLELALETRGIIRPRLTPTDESGRSLEPRRDSSAGGRTVLAYDVEPGDYTLEVARPDSYLTLVYDDSSSMGESVDVVKSVLKGFLDNLGQGLFLQLMKYADDPVFLSDFTNKPAELRKAVDKEVGAGGGTDSLKGLMAAVQSVAKQPGSRAVLAIFDDLVHSGSDHLEQYIRLWDAVLDQGIAFSTIGVQSGWDDESNYFGNSREQIFRELAYSSLGGFFLSPTYDKVKESAQRIFEQLTSPMEYRLIAEWREAERGPGSIEIKLDRTAEKEAAKSVEIIMDASNSMWGQIAGEAKITIARRVLAETIGGLPDTMSVGLRVYGHRYGLNDPKACTDTELLVPIGPVDKKALVDTVNRIQLKGKTPLVHSVLEAVKDFEKIPNGSIVLVTDGIESCGGDIASIAPAIKKAGLELQVHVVGFDIKEKEARAELESIAKSTQGRYLDARNAGELLSALEQTLKLEYAVLDAKGGEVGRGVVGGGPVTLDSGTYTVRVLVSPQPLELKVTVKPRSSLTLSLKKVQGQWKIE